MEFCLLSQFIVALRSRVDMCGRLKLAKVRVSTIVKLVSARMVCLCDVRIMCVNYKPWYI